MIFAAGFGTRMGPLTKFAPKPLIKVAGKPLIDYAIATLREAGVTQIVANSHYRFEQLEEHLKRHQVIISREVPNILDTGGGLKAALPKLAADTVITLNADVVWFGLNPIKSLTSAWRPDTMDALLLCVPLDRALGRDNDGDFTIRPDSSVERGGSSVYTGAQIIKTAAVIQETKRVFSLNRVWNRLAACRRLFGNNYDGIWCDVGHEKGVALAESQFRSGDV